MLAALAAAAMLFSGQLQSRASAEEDAPAEATPPIQKERAEPRHERQPARRGGWNGEPVGWRQGFAKRPREFQSDQGYLLVDGAYLPPPYSIQLAQGTLSVNDHELASAAPSEQAGPYRGFAMTELFERVGYVLNQGGVVLAFTEQPVVTLPNARERYDLFSQLLGRKTVKNISWSDQLPPGFDRERWDTWLRDYRPSMELRKRMEADLAELDEREANAQAAVAATRRLNRFSYPLTVLGMIGTVLGVGHLLSHRPPTGTQTPDVDSTPDALRVVRWSLLLVIALSALDLTWTVLASQAGQMRELNPLGSQLIDDPLRLTLFKVGITGAAVALLFALRKYRKAQLAAWWICLILTLLTARWLTLNSMFVSA